MGILTQLDDNNFESAVVNGLWLVDFVADWCGPCRMMEPIMNELAVEMDGKAQIGKLDVDASQRTTSDLNVTSIPTLILFKNGQEVYRFAGIKDKDSLKRLMESVQ